VQSLLKVQRDKVGHSLKPVSVTLKRGRKARRKQGRRKAQDERPGKHVDSHLERIEWQNGGHSRGKRHQYNRNESNGGKRVNWNTIHGANNRSKRGQRN